MSHPEVLKIFICKRWAPCGGDCPRRASSPKLEIGDSWQSIGMRIRDPGSSWPDKPNWWPWRASKKGSKLQHQLQSVPVRETRAPGSRALLNVGDTGSLEHGIGSQVKPRQSPCLEAPSSLLGKRSNPLIPGTSLYLFTVQLFTNDKAQCLLTRTKSIQ